MCAWAVLVPAEAGYHAIGRAGVLDLEHGALARLVRRRHRLGHDPVEAGTLEALKPIARNSLVVRSRRQVNRWLRAGHRLFDRRSSFALRPPRGEGPAAASDEISTKWASETSLAAASTRSRVAAPTRSGRPNARETVEGATPALLATS